MEAVRIIITPSAEGYAASVWRSPEGVEWQPGGTLHARSALQAERHARDRLLSAGEDRLALALPVARGSLA